MREKVSNIFDSKALVCANFRITRRRAPTDAKENSVRQMKMFERRRSRTMWL